MSWGAKGAPDSKGWRSVSPGGAYGFAIGLGAVMTLGLAAIWLFVGSSRADGAEQMRILFWLIMAFGAGTLITLIQYGQARRTAIRWRGENLRWRGKDGGKQSATLGEATALRSSFLGPVWIVFADGRMLRVDPYARNAPLLIETLSKRLHPEG